MNQEEIMEALKHQNTISHTLTRNLRELQVKAANYGLDVPVSISNQIRHTEAELKKCQAEVVRLQALDTERQIDPNTSDSSYVDDNVDSFLRFWVSMAEQHGLESSVTLSVNGLLISGTIVSYKRYMEGLLDQLEATMKVTGSSNPEEFKNGLISGLRKGALETDIEDKEQEILEEKEDEQNKSESIVYLRIHLLNCRVWHPSTRINPDEIGRPWRVRLDAVDGFMLGTPFS